MKPLFIIIAHLGLIASIITCLVTGKPADPYIAALLVAIIVENKS